jgi:hypothetical protein
MHFNDNDQRHDDSYFLNVTPLICEQDLSQVLLPVLRFPNLTEHIGKQT